MTVSIRRMLMGHGVRYLMETVARGDGAADRSSPLTRYYAESGTPPGRFIGAGLAGLAGGSGVAAGSECDELALWRMVGECSDPATGGALGVTPKDGSVAAFDLTFSVPKSISTAWAVADAGTQSIIFEAHQEAIRRTIAYGEQHVFTSRTGRNGVVRSPITGIVAAGFDHWDSRAGDPQLHTHVIIQNRGLGLDGKWRTLDSRGIFRHVVTLSEIHQGVLQDLLTARLGWGWDARERKYSDRPKWEAQGVGQALMNEFSQRSAQIEGAVNELIAKRESEKGRTLTTAERITIRRKVTISTRPEKQHRSLREMTEEWRRRARPFVGEDTAAWVTTLANRNDLPLLRSDDLRDEILTDLAASVTFAVAERRATFTRANLLAETHRQLHGVRFADPTDRIAVGERTVDLAIGVAVSVTPAETRHVPMALRDAEGSSRFQGRMGQVYTTELLLEAETRLLAAGARISAPVVPVATVAAVAEQNLPDRDYGLSVDQALACEKIATSGRALDVLVGPAGTGKSTAMLGLRAMWESAHGTGSVVGLAPSASAAEVLSDELGAATENTAKWLTELRRNDERREDLARIDERITNAPIGLGHPSDSIPALKREAAKLRADINRWEFRAGQLVIIDEASLAGTFSLDEIVTRAGDAGAKVLLVGDWAQLSAVEAGGAFSMLVRDRDMAPELTDVRRFISPWEKAASVRLRVGDASAIDVYDGHGRIASGDREEMLDALYTSWRQDTDAGLTSLMIAGDTPTVAALNQRAQRDRIDAGLVTNVGPQVAGGDRIGVGDRVITRRNDRRLSTGKRWVKNGDAWDVTAVFADGAVAVKRARGGGEVVLPADYVREHVGLGYASTAHRAQGSTVDTAHAMVSPTTPREVLYVGATRGRQSNRLYVDTAYDPDPDTQHGHAAAGPSDAREVLAAIMETATADRSAHEMLHLAKEEADGMQQLAAEYLTIAAEAQREHWAAVFAACGFSDDQVQQIVESEAYGPLVAAIRRAEARGQNIDAALPQLVAAQQIDSADDLASVLHYRVDKWGKATSTGKRPPRDRSIVGLFPRVAGIADPDMQRALDERAVAMEQRAAAVLKRAIRAGAPWVEPLGTPPADAHQYARWEREARVVAAFVDLHGDMILTSGDAKTSTEHGNLKAAQHAATTARELARRAAADYADYPSTHAAHQQQGVPFS